MGQLLLRDSNSFINYPDDNVRFVALVKYLDRITIGLGIFYGIVDPINTALWTTWLFLFTTSGYVFIAIIGLYTRRHSKFDMSFIPKILGAGIIGIIVYDLWTNFGFWLSYSKLGFYPQTYEGLFSVFIGGIPFMLWHILSFSIVLTIILIPIIKYKDLSILSYKNILNRNIAESN